MSQVPNIHNYESKIELYYQEKRPEMQSFVPIEAKTILDVGCSEGFFGEALKVRQQCEIWGVEIMPKAAEAAGERLDKVFHGPFSADFGLPENYFDCIVFNDCLEHLADSETALLLAGRLLKVSGCIVASIPNMRYFPAMCNLARGEWEYEDSGVMDRTHLRFFTQKSIRKMFVRTGFKIQTMQGINSEFWGKPYFFRFLNAVLFGTIKDMAFQQFAVRARVAK